MRVLLSVKPEYAEKILSGRKRFEFRKAIFRRPNVKIVVLYSTMPVGRVVGEFAVADVHSAKPADVWTLTRQFAGISRTFFNEYFEGRDVAHAIEVRTVKRYRKPLALSQLVPSGCAPQSFRYL